MAERTQPQTKVRRVYDCLRGVRFGGLLRAESIGLATGIGRKSTSHALQWLSERGHAEHVTENGKTGWRLTKQGRATEIRWHTARGFNEENVLAFLAKHPGASALEVAEATGMLHQNAGKYLRAMVLDGRVHVSGSRVNEQNQQVAEYKAGPAPANTR